MKLISVAVALIVLFGRVNSSAVNCKDTCNQIRNEFLSEPHTCSPALTINPSPDVYKACQQGKKSAFDKACVPLCSNEETTTMASLASRACRSNRGRGPSDYWCKRGFSSVLKKLEAYSFPVSEEIIDDEVEISIPQDEVEAISEEDTFEAIDSSETFLFEESEVESLEEKPEEELEVVLVQEIVSEEEDEDAYYTMQAKQPGAEEVARTVENEF